MQLNSDVSLNAIINSLSKIVLPAIDSDNALAQEQLQVSIGLLQLMAARAPLEFDYDCDELRRLVEFTQKLVNVAPAAVDTDGLLSSTQFAEQILSLARISPSEIQSAIRILRRESGVLITDAYKVSSNVERDALAKVVLMHADAQLLRERAWVLPQGWELQPDEIPEIADLIEYRKTGSVSTEQERD